MENLIFTIFGVTSNLAQIKVIPALFNMYKLGFLPKNIIFVGTSLRERSEVEMKKFIQDSIGIDNSEIFESFYKKFRFVNGSFEDNIFYEKLGKLYVGENCGNRIFHLAISNSLYEILFENLHANRLDISSCGWVRLMIEKPIGNDLESAKRINQILKKYYKEDQIFRIDHYLAKETIQNILAFRFDNQIFEPILNNNYIDHIQITAAESFGVENRGFYYDQTGALRDVGQNHILQMIALVTMENPVEFSNENITQNRMEVFENLKVYPDSLVLGQYRDYSVNEVTTDTFFSFKTELGKGKFSNIPIYVRAGKKLEKSVTEIDIVFKGEKKKRNVLSFRIQPNEGILMRIRVKKPGMGMMTREDTLKFCYESGTLVNPYERLVFDVMNGDQTYFNDAQEIEAQWKFIDKLKGEADRKVYEYENGGWGPKESEIFIENEGRQWLEHSNFCCHR